MQLTDDGLALHAHARRAGTGLRGAGDEHALPLRADQAAVDAATVRDSGRNKDQLQGTLKDASGKQAP